jgi:anti-anti-sigma factor
MAELRAPEITRQNGITVVALGPDYENLDEAELLDLSPVLLQAAEQADPPLLVLDMPHTEFFGSAFIEILFRLWNKLNARGGGRFAISGLTQYCAEVIQVTHLDRLWELYGSQAEAVAGLGKK